VGAAIENIFVIVGALPVDFGSGNQPPLETGGIMEMEWEDDEPRLTTRAVRP